MLTTHAMITKKVQKQQKMDLSWLKSTETLTLGIPVFYNKTRNFKAGNLML